MLKRNEGLNRRLTSLDAFRGLTIAAMLFVNNAGDWSRVWAPLRHSDWNGCTAADLVFPFFLFIMGAAMAFAREKTPAEIARRTLVLSLLNLALALFAWGAFGNFRFFGVLQRIAFCYLGAALILRRSDERAIWRWTAGLLLGYTLILALAPGGTQKFLCVGDRLDTWLLGPRLYEFDAATGLGHDPEGLLSTLGALATTLTGALCGMFLRRADLAGARKSAGLASAGLILLVLARPWGRILPFNKNLWTPSYVLLGSGWAFLALAALHELIDVRGVEAWASPFVDCGRNAIAAYVGVGVVSYATVWIRWDGAALKTRLYQSLLESWIPAAAGPCAASAAWGAVYVALCLAATRILARRGIFLKV